MDLMNTAREFVMGLPDGLQGLGVFLAGLVPFVEGEGAGLIGVVVGVHPWVAIPAAVLGNLLAVALLVYAAHGVRSAVTARRDGGAHAVGRVDQERDGEEVAQHGGGDGHPRVHPDDDADQPGALALDERHEAGKEDAEALQAVGQSHHELACGVHQVHRDHVPLQRSRSGNHRVPRRRSGSGRAPEP